MKKVAVVYWSGTGNTEAMANAVVEGIRTAGAEADLFTASSFGAGKMDEYDAVAFGCPSMAGATESGCAIGRVPAKRMARYLPVTV